MNGAGLQSIIIVLVNCYILYTAMPDVEKRLSTVYILLDVFLQTLLYNLAITLLAFIGIFMLGISPNYFISFTLMPLLFNYLWIKAALNPNE